MARLIHRLALLLCVALTVSTAGLAEEAEITKAIRGGDLMLDLRWRYERVDAPAFDNVSNASTVRLRVGYKTDEWHGLWALGELQGTISLGNELYNSTQNGKVDFPVVADPQDSDINRMILAYSGLKETDFKLGRQRVNLINQRFYGAVDWRQLQQTFDGFVAQTDYTKPFSLYYGYFNRVNRIFGEHNPNELAANLDLKNHAGQLTVKTKPGTFQFYVHLNELQDLPPAGVCGTPVPCSHRNVGGRFSGATELSEKIKLQYVLEYMQQDSYANSPEGFDSPYNHVNFGVTTHGIVLLAGLERLGSDDGTYGTQAPFGTLHKFNGWADRFLVTPADGLRDTYFVLGGNLSGYKMRAIYHDFDRDAGPNTYGNELDLLITKAFSKTYSFGIKYANYRSDDATTMRPAPLHRLDQENFWFWLQLKI